MQSLAEPLYLSWQHSSPFWMTSLIQKERNSTFLQQPAGTQHRHDPETRNCPASTLAHTLIHTRIMSAEVPAHEKKTQGNKLPQLHALEEDDEFEEFAVEGTDLFNKIYGSIWTLAYIILNRLGREGSAR